MEDNLSGFLEQFSKVSKKPYDFLSVQENLSEDIKVLIKEIYDYTKSKEESRSKNALPKLIIEKFDDEQIWQELELQNSNAADNIIENVSQLSVKKDKLKFPLKLKCNKFKENKQTLSVDIETEHGKNIDNSFDDEEIENGNLEGDDDYDEDDEEEDDTGSEFEEDTSETPTGNSLKKGKLKPSVVDDKFFKLAELELFLQNEEKNQEKLRSATM